MNIMGTETQPVCVDEYPTRHPPHSTKNSYTIINCNSVLCPFICRPYDSHYFIMVTIQHQCWCSTLNFSPLHLWKMFFILVCYSSSTPTMARRVRFTFRTEFKSDFKLYTCHLSCSFTLLHQLVYFCSDSSF